MIIVIIVVIEVGTYKRIVIKFKYYINIVNNGR